MRSSQDGLTEPSDLEQNLELMKRLSIILVLVTAFIHVQAQELKKIKATELQAYIRKADHPLIINFWATYCKPCLQEIPYFESTVAKYKAQGVELLLVSVDLPSYFPGKIMSFARDQKFTSSIMWLNETNADYFCPLIDKKWSGAIPASLFINNKTKFRRFFERQLTDQQVDETVSAMTKE